MEIKNTLIKLADPYRAKAEQNAETVRAQRGAAEGAAPAAAQGDRVSLSSEARLATAALSAAQSAPDIRRQKIENVKERIESGEYTIDPKNIAGKLLRDDSLLAGTLK